MGYEMKFFILMIFVLFYITLTFESKPQYTTYNDEAGLDSFQRDELPSSWMKKLRNIHSMLKSCQLSNMRLRLENQKLKQGMIKTKSDNTLSVEVPERDGYFSSTILDENEDFLPSFWLPHLKNVQKLLKDCKKANNRLNKENFNLQKLKRSH